MPGNSDEAEIIEGFLDSEGIRAMIEHAETTTFPATFGKLGDVRVYVPAEEKERALELLRNREREYEESVDDDDETLVTDEGVAAIDESAEAETE